MSKLLKPIDVREKITSIEKLFVFNRIYFKKNIFQKKSILHRIKLPLSVHEILDAVHWENSFFIANKW